MDCTQLRSKQIIDQWSLTAGDYYIAPCFSSTYKLRCIISLIWVYSIYMKMVCFLPCFDVRYDTLHRYGTNSNKWPDGINTTKKKLMSGNFGFENICSSNNIPTPAEAVQVMVTKRTLCTQEHNTPSKSLCKLISSVITWAKNTLAFIYIKMLFNSCILYYISQKLLPRDCTHEKIALTLVRNQKSNIDQFFFYILHIYHWVCYAPWIWALIKAASTISMRNYYY